MHVCSKPSAPTSSRLPAANSGERNKSAKLTEGEVLQILALPHMTLETLAGRFGVSVFAVHAIRVGKRWRHIPR